MEVTPFAVHVMLVVFSMESAKTSRNGQMAWPAQTNGPFPRSITAKAIGNHTASF